MEKWYISYRYKDKNSDQGWTPHKDPGEYTPTYLSLGEGTNDCSILKFLIICRAPWR